MKSSLASLSSRSLYGLFLFLMGLLSFYKKSIAEKWLLSREISQDEQLRGTDDLKDHTSSGLSNAKE